MSSGLLWMDDEKARPFEEKVKRAIEHCQKVRGFTPLWVEVNYGVSGETKVGKVLVKPVKHVLPHHFLLVREGT